jgi:hypothetical protein
VRKGGGHQTRVDRVSCLPYFWFPLFKRKAIIRYRETCALNRSGGGPLSGNTILRAQLTVRAVSILFLLVAHGLWTSFAAPVAQRLTIATMTYVSGMNHQRNLKSELITGSDRAGHLLNFSHLQPFALLKFWVGVLNVHLPDIGSDLHSLGAGCEADRAGAQRGNRETGRLEVRTHQSDPGIEHRSRRR